MGLHRVMDYSLEEGAQASKVPKVAHRSGNRELGRSSCTKTTTEEEKKTGVPKGAARARTLRGPIAKINTNIKYNKEGMK